MTSSELLDIYHTLAELTGAMVKAAHEDDWDHLATLEQRCQTGIAHLMNAAPVRLNESEQCSRIATIRTILQNDAVIRALAEPRLHALQQRLHETRSGRSRANAYAAQR